jgi:hypothetical protein
MNTFEKITRAIATNPIARERIQNGLLWAFISSLSSESEVRRVAEALVVKGVVGAEDLSEELGLPLENIEPLLQTLYRKLLQWRRGGIANGPVRIDPPKPLFLRSMLELESAIAFSLDEEVLAVIGSEVKYAWADKGTEDSGNHATNESPPPVPSTPKTPGWLSNFIIPGGPQPAGAMAANAKGGQTKVTRQLEFKQDGCVFWVEFRQISGRTRIVLCSEDEGKLSSVQSIAFGNDVADIERIGNDAVVKIDRIVLDTYRCRLESSEGGSIPCPTLIFSRNG